MFNFRYVEHLFSGANMYGWLENSLHSQNDQTKRKTVGIKASEVKLVKETFYTSLLWSLMAYSLHPHLASQGETGSRSMFSEIFSF